MAERIVSPGVYTNEIDQSFLPGAIGQIGAAVVGPTVKGPALVPTAISSYGDFEKVFGPFTENSYVPLVVQEYLRNGGPVITVTRLLYEDGYNYQNGVLAVIATSASVETITHVLHPTYQIAGTTAAQAGNIFTDSVINSGTSGSFEIKISGSYTTYSSGPFSLYAASGTSISASINSSDNNYVTKIFGINPYSADYPVYVQYENKTATSLFNNLGSVSIKLVKLSDYKFQNPFSVAETPWITSQKIGSVAKNLFKFATLSHGTSVNHEVKVGISNIKTSTEVTDPDGWPTFDVIVRRVNTVNIKNSPYSSTDTDKQPDVIQTFVGVNLNPDSPRYIAKVIGDRYQTVSSAGDLILNGEYPNQSQFIRVVVDDSVTKKNNDKTLFPFGFRALTSPIPTSMSSGSTNLSAVSYVTTQGAGSSYDRTNFHGFNFSVINNLNYLAPTPSSASTSGSNVDFYLGDVSQSAVAGFPTATTAYSGSLQSALTGGTFTANVATSTRKFIVPFQGGFDGTRPNLPKNSGTDIVASNTFGFDCSSATSTGTLSYKKAFAILGNTDYYDLNMLLTPGIIQSIHPDVTLAARNLVETRQDTFYVMDSNQITDSVSTVATTVQTIDSNYTACYWPWVKVQNGSKDAWVPPSVVIPGVLAFNDRVSAPWYAPAGLNRGVLSTVKLPYLNLNQDYRDTLYEARVNPIANFPNNGIVVWGQKTLQARPSALDRVNVRRLLIAVKKFIASSTRFLVFEQNTNQTRQKFLNIANPYLESVKNNQGLFAFRVIMDDTNNTPDLIDQNILYGQLFLQPTRTAEFIILDFNIQPTGAAFPE